MASIEHSFKLSLIGNHWSSSLAASLNPLKSCPVREGVDGLAYPPMDVATTMASAVAARTAIVPTTTWGSLITISSDGLLLPFCC